MVYVAEATTPAFPTAQAASSTFSASVSRITTSPTRATKATSALSAAPALPAGSAGSTDPAILAAEPSISSHAALSSAVPTSNACTYVRVCRAARIWWAAINGRFDGHLPKE